ncbi:MAG: nucleotidyltransferase family protein [Rhodospirillales bacterium]|nr:nucleotidyltransferase family protein [Rhodospirillales bacterium]
MSRRRRALGDLVHCLRGVPVALPDWAPVLAIANEHLLTPTLWTALSDSGQAAALPADARDYLATLHRLNGDRNRALRRQAIELIGALNAKGIVPALLKGGLTLFDGPYADPATRMMRDLDILVPNGSRGDAIAVLGRLGYRLAQPYAVGHHAYGDFARPNDPGSVDLHIELVDPSHVLSAAEVWDRAEPKEVAGETGGVRYLAPCATDRIMHNLLHAQIHYLGNFYRGELQVQQVYELVALARHLGPAVDWSFVQQRLRAHHLTVALESYLLAAHRLFGLEWPLSKPPGLAAHVNYLRCDVQFGTRPLQWIGIPWGNLRGALAWHRMHALHGDVGGPLRWRCRHLLQYLRKKGIGATLDRLLRVQ